MDDRLHLIRYLYGEEEDESALARRLSGDEDLYREYEELAATKRALDDRPARRPDAAVVDQVVDEAREAAHSSGPRSTSPAEDRPARSPSRPWTRRLQTAGAALALLMVIGLGWWQGGGRSDGPVADSATPGALDEPARQAPTAAETRTSNADDVPAWDDGEELVRIQRRIDRLQARSAPDRWGALQRVGRP
ncbi:hypothetical protein [Salinibacter altiplanensis]|uniref:hypothetical protein n=1 Tax=Salinibacter altiplanensis TaxID=1803181 RepID=UPI001F16642A|nr:hypothetical protein [Salinibacter altiplanensis]